MNVIAHRGGPPPYLECSCKAIDYSFAHGADTIEVDVRFSSDGIPFALHDEDLLRLFGVDKKVSEMSASFLTSLGNNRTGRVASLFSVLNHCRGRGELLIHIKELTAESTDIIKEILSSDPGKVILGVVNRKSYQLLRKLNIPARFLAFIPGKDDYNEWHEDDIEIIRLWENWVSTARINRIHDLGKKVWIMSGHQDGIPGETTSDRINVLQGFGIDGILLNDPGLIIK